jgi:DNA-binding beta-propeller fold protein YncE
MNSRLFGALFLSIAVTGCGWDNSSSGVNPSNPEVAPSMKYRWEVNGHPTEVAVYSDGLTTHSARMVLDAEHGRLYVADENAEQLKTVDVASKRLIGEAAVGGKPVRLAVTADGKRALVTRADGTLRIIDTGNGHLLGDVTVGASAFGVAVTGGGRYAYVADPDDAGVGLVDTGSGSDPQDTLVAVADTVTHAIRFYDGDGRSLSNTLIAVTPSSLAFAPDRSKLVVGFNLGGAPGMAVLDFTTATTRIVPMDTPADTLPLEAAPAVESDGRYAYMVAGRALYIIDTAAGPSFGSTRAVRLGSQALSVAVGPGGIAYVLTDDMTITVIGEGPSVSIVLR